MTWEVIELRLPPILQYLPVLRAAIGAIAGTMAFNYDDIIQLRTAASEAFGLAVELVTRGHQVSPVNELAVRCSIQPDKLEILILASTDYARLFDTKEDKEAESLLNSLMDELEFGTGTAGSPMVRIAKYKPAVGA